MSNQAIFIDPSSDHFLDDKLFDTDNASLNRDGTLLPFAALRKHYEAQGIPVHTADKLRDGSKKHAINHYWSLGLLESYKDFLDDSSVRLRGFILLEPPLVQPEMYEALPELTTVFENIFIHNTHGDGYSLTNVDTRKLCKIFWPQPYGDVLPEYWANSERLNKLVVISGSHNPGNRKPEFYSERIKAISALSSYDGVDLFGRGWERWWGGHARWWPYWRYFISIRSSFRGSCSSKWPTLSQYRFSLCFENMPMSGYVTEKIFDCLYAGTVPVYWGAPDIDTLLPADAFVDMRRFSSYDEMYHFVTTMSDVEWQGMREAGRRFLQEKGAAVYRDSLLKVISL